MAKRKLTDAQRATIRKEIARHLKAGHPQSDVLQSIAKKYSISTESVRWYLKDVRKGGRPSLPKKGLPKNGHPAKAGKSTSKPKGQANGSRFGRGASLLDMVRNVSTAALHRVLQAKKLLPKLESLRKKYANLEAVERTVKASLGAVAGELRSLERRIGRLTSN